MQEGDQISELSKRFGKHFKQWRKGKRLLIKQVAAELHVSEQVVSDWERGVRFPSQKHLLVLERYSSMPICNFLCPPDRGCAASQSMDS